MEATLAQAIAVRDALRSRLRNAPWLRGIGIGRHGRGYCVEIRTWQPVPRMPSVVRGVPLRAVAVSEAVPLAMPPWRSSGRPDRHGAAPRADLASGLGPALPVDAFYGWRGAARWINFESREAKAAYMADAARHDAADPAVRAWARSFAALPRPAREEAILRFVQLCIRYERDPAWFDEEGHRHGIELLDSSAVGLIRGYGDCDVKARLFVALCLACGVQAEIEPVFRGKYGFPRVRARVLTVRGKWETADPTIVNSTIGVLPRHPLTALPHEAEGAPAPRAS